MRYLAIIVLALAGLAELLIRALVVGLLLVGIVGLFIFACDPEYAVKLLRPEAFKLAERLVP